MALDWSNERYVRLYTRITPDMALWCWQAKAIWPWLLAAADRAGVIAARKGARAIAKLVDMPLEVVTEGLEGEDGLLADGCVVATADGYVIRNYVEAQTAVASVNKRVADHRARQRRGDTLDVCNDGNNDVTRGNAESASVTPVTPIRSEQSGTDPIRADRDGSASPSIAIGTLPGLEPVKAEQAKPSRKRASVAMPSDFAPGDAHRAFAAEHQLDLTAEFDRFRLHHEAKGSVFASWPAALSTWLSNAVRFASERRSRGGDGPGGPRSPPTAARGSAAGRALVARLEAEEAARRSQEPSR